MIAPLVRKCAAIAFVFAPLLGIPQFAETADAPFGFVWSQAAESLPQPSSIFVEANIIELTYKGPTLPPQFTNAEMVVLKVCKRFGLQQVRWISRGFSRSEAIELFLDIYEEGVKRYGEADKGDLDHGTAAWSAEHIGMRMEREKDDKYRILMISDGPQFEQCQTE